VDISGTLTIVGGIPREVMMLSLGNSLACTQIIVKFISFGHTFKFKKRRFTTSCHRLILGLLDMTRARGGGATLPRATRSFGTLGCARWRRDFERLTAHPGFENIWGDGARGSPQRVCAPRSRSGVGQRIIEGGRAGFLEMGAPCSA